MKSQSRDLDAMLEAELVNGFENATLYAVCLFLGRGEWDRYYSRDLLECLEIGRKMEEHHVNHRKCMVYAIMPDQRSIFLPTSWLWEKLNS